MTSENTSKLGKLLLYSIIILILQIVAVILHGFVGTYTLPFIINRTTIIMLAAMLLVTAIIGPRVIEKQKYVPLIIGITIAAMSAIFIIYILDPLIHNITVIASYHLTPLDLVLYIVLIVIHSVSIVFAVLILIRGI
ncbi:MAG: hypothetical protein LUQ65_04315, partial [Candidatus Helarchaeota archaeon]|nr:hypothetical protein [Candidatus Helarchaeota archaeon]